MTDSRNASSVIADSTIIAGSTSEPAPTLRGLACSGHSSRIKCAFDPPAPNELIAALLGHDCGALQCCNSRWMTKGVRAQSTCRLGASA